MPALAVVLGALAAPAVTVGSSWRGGATASATTPSTSERGEADMSRERQEPNRLGETEVDRHRRAVQAADRLRAQLQTTMQAAVEADEEVPAEVREAMLVLERWARKIAQLPPAK
jgi:hypothetical protein